VHPGKLTHPDTTPKGYSADTALRPACTPGS
jgi:hypothetical protein